MPLTFASRIAFTYPAGEQTLHANFHADDTGFYFASSGTVFAFSTAGVRESSRDVTLSNHPTGTIWGFTRDSNGQWVTMQRTTGTGVIGRIGIYDEDGFPVHVTNVPDVVTGVNQVSTAFRAPKAIVEVDGNYYVRVVRSTIGNMRFLKFDSTGDVQTDDLVVSESDPTSLSDAASNGIQNIFIIQQNEHRAYAVNAENFQIISNLQTDLDSQNTAPWAASAHGDTLYVADRGGYVYRYTGVPDTRVSTAKKGTGLGLIQALSLNAMLGRNMRRDDR